MLPFLLLGVAVFIVGRANQPLVVCDVAYFRGLSLRKEVQELRNFEIAGVPEQKRFDEQLGKIEKDVERIIDDGRRRQYSRWRSDALAIAIVVSGVLAAALHSWKSDGRRLTQSPSAEPNRTTEAAAISLPVDSDSTPPPPHL